MAWWIAEKDSPMDLEGRIEVSEAAAKGRAVAMSLSAPGRVFQVRYHANANAPTEVRCEAHNGELHESAAR